VCSQPDSEGTGPLICVTHAHAVLISQDKIKADHRELLRQSSQVQPPLRIAAYIKVCVLHVCMGVGVGWGLHTLCMCVVRVCACVWGWGLRTLCMCVVRVCACVCVRTCVCMCACNVFAPSFVFR